MLRSPFSRGVVVVLALAGLVGLYSWYATLSPLPAMGTYPGPAQFLSIPDPYLGEQVATGGRVVGTNPLVLELPGQPGTPRLTLTHTSLAASEGAKVRAFGVLTGPRTIAVTNAFVVPQQGLWFTWTVSFLAGVWVLARIVRDWTIEREPAGLVPRNRRPDGEE